MENEQKIKQLADKNTELENQLKESRNTLTTTEKALTEKGQELVTVNKDLLEVTKKKEEELLNFKRKNENNNTRIEGLEAENHEQREELNKLNQLKEGPRDFQKTEAQIEWKKKVTDAMIQLKDNFQDINRNTTTLERRPSGDFYLVHNLIKVHYYDYDINSSQPVEIVYEFQTTPAWMYEMTINDTPVDTHSTFEYKGDVPALSEDENKTKLGEEIENALNKNPNYLVKID